MLAKAVHHIATATNDLDRMISFQREVFELEPLPGFPRETPVGRIAFYDLGGVQLQIVEQGAIAPAPAETPAILLQRDLRLDHYTVLADSEDAFDVIVERLRARGAAAGDTTTFGEQRLQAFRDPEGHLMEVLSPGPS